MNKIIVVVIVVILVVGGYFVYQQSVTNVSSTANESTPPVMDTNSDMKIDDTENQEMAKYVDINTAEAKKMIDENPDLIVIDVSPHYTKGHLPGAVSYYLGDGSLDKAIPKLDKSKDYLVYCHVDSVAIAGAQKLVDAGFSPVYRLQGNYSAWVDAGYPVEK